MKTNIASSILNYVLRNIAIHIFVYMFISTQFLISMIFIILYNVGILSLECVVNYPNETNIFFFPFVCYNKYITSTQNNKVYEDIIAYILYFDNILSSNFLYYYCKLFILFISNQFIEYICMLLGLIEIKLSDANNRIIKECIMPCIMPQNPMSFLSMMLPSSNNTSIPPSKFVGKQVDHNPLLEDSDSGSFIDESSDDELVPSNVD